MKLLEFIQVVSVMNSEYQQADFLAPDEDLVIELPNGTDYRILDLLELSADAVVQHYSNDEQPPSYVPDLEDPLFDGKSQSLIEAEVIVNKLKKPFENVNLYCVDPNTPAVIVASNMASPKAFGLDIINFTIPDPNLYNSENSLNQGFTTTESIAIVKKQFIGFFLSQILSYYPRFYLLNNNNSNEPSKVRFLTRTSSSLNEE